MEPGAGAVPKNGWWVWHPTLPPQERISLAASGMTPSGWRLCHTDGCVELGATAGDEVSLSGCR
jgi:hypothetical protein